MKIHFYSPDLPVVFSMRDNPPDGISVVVPPARESFDADLSQKLFEFVIQFGSGVSATLVAEWVIKKYSKSKSKTITIDRKEVLLDKGEIVKIIEERIAEHTDDK
jgi:hypothetical protein